MSLREPQKVLPFFHEPHNIGAKTNLKEFQIEPLKFVTKRTLNIYSQGSWNEPSDAVYRIQNEPLNTRGLKLHQLHL